MLLEKRHNTYQKSKIISPAICSKEIGKNNTKQISKIYRTARLVIRQKELHVQRVHFFFRKSLSYYEPVFPVKYSFKENDSIQHAKNVLPVYWYSPREETAIKMSSVHFYALHNLTMHFVKTEQNKFQSIFDLCIFHANQILIFSFIN